MPPFVNRNYRTWQHQSSIFVEGDFRGEDQNLAKVHSGQVHFQPDGWKVSWGTYPYVSLSCRGWASGHPGPKWQGFLPQSLQTLAQHGYAGYGILKLCFSRRICTAEGLGIARCVSEKGTSASQVTSHFRSDDEDHWRSPLHWKFAFPAWDFSRSWTTLRCTSRSALKWDQGPTRP